MQGKPALAPYEGYVTAAEMVAICLAIATPRSIRSVSGSNGRSSWNTSNAAYRHKYPANHSHPRSQHHLHHRNRRLQLEQHRRQQQGRTLACFAHSNSHGEHSHSHGEHSHSHSEQQQQQQRPPCNGGEPRARGHLRKGQVRQTRFCCWCVCN